MLAQRARRFRLFPIRAICRVRSRSTARADAVHVRVLAIASRSSAEGDTPAADALSRQAACSPGVTRAATITVRRAVTGRGGDGARGAGSRARPLIPQRRGKLGVQGGRSVPLASPQCSTLRGLAYAPYGCQTAPGGGRRTACGTGNLWSAASPYRTRRSPAPTVSTARSEAVSQDFQRRPGVGSASADAASIAARQRKSDASLAGAGEARSSTANASLNARPESLPEEDSTILRIALMDQADSRLLALGGSG